MLNAGGNTGRFEAAVLIHLDAAWNLARWLMRSEADAQDVVQEACLRAFKSFDTFRGSDGRCWFLAIVRNACRSWMERNHRQAAATPESDLDELESAHAGPLRLLLQQGESDIVRQAIEDLPADFRETIVLRELEGLSYKEISTVTQAPVGTVMSRLARGRKRLEQTLSPHILEEA